VQDIVDLWVNLVTEQSAKDFVAQTGYENIPGYLGSSREPVGVDSLRGASAIRRGPAARCGGSASWPSTRRLRWCG